MGYVIIFNLLKDGHFIHELLPPAPFHRLNGYVLYALLFSSFVDHRVFASADLLLNVIIIHI